MFIQQVEPDWLKFDNFYENGLKQIWQQAYSYPDKLHFIILEDLNMSSIECYGKPLNDLLGKTRKVLPGLGTTFPKNLWVFGIPIILSTHTFGLPLVKDTFLNWGAFPKIDGGWPFCEIKSDRVLGLETLLNHDLIGAPSIDDYFTI